MDTTRKDLVSTASTELKATEADAAGKEQFVTFGLAGSEFGVDITQVKEIIRLPDKITAVPQAPAVVIGLVQLRGTLVPLLCLRRVFELPAVETPDRKILIADLPTGLVGLVVDDVREVQLIPLACQQHKRVLKQTFSDRFIDGIANQHERVTMLLDLAALDAEYGSQIH
jgi:purine-binding chemotaxis protein CheW